MNFASENLSTTKSNDFISVIKNRLLKIKRILIQRDYFLHKDNIVINKCTFKLIVNPL